MKKTILYVHPWDGSYNHALVKTLTNMLDDRQEEYYLIDLYKDEFNPVLKSEDLALYAKGESQDILVKKYQEILSDTSELVMIFPIWWYEPPAMVKGFFEKVMLKGFSYEEKKTGLKGHLTHIYKTTIFTTGSSPKLYLKWMAGNYIKKVFIGSTMRDVGLKNAKWHHLGRIKAIPQEKREIFLEKAKDRI